MCKKDDDFMNVNSFLEPLNFSECNSQSWSCNDLSINRLIHRLILSFLKQKKSHMLVPATLI